MPKLKKGKKGSDALAKISGLSKKTIHEIWIEVKANNVLLRSCSFHKFEPHPSPNMSRRFICTRCMGVVGAVEKSWYERGLEHGNH